MKNVCILFLMTISSIVWAQQSKPISEENPLVLDGLEYGYSIKNISTREVNNKDFSRHEVTLYVTNKGACSRVVLFGESMNQFEAEMRTLAKFDCINATGARLTSKGGELYAKPMYVHAKVKTRDDKGKYILENQRVQVGYYLGAGETIEETVIFIVPLNSKPDIRVRLVNNVSVL